MQEFEHFKVPPSLLCDLYRENLVALNEPRVADTGKKQPGTETAPLQAPEVQHWQERSRGRNANGFWVLVDLPGQPVLPAAESAYLDTIIRACQRDPADCLVLNLHGLDSANFSQWVPQPAPRQVWMAGLEPHKISLPVRFPAFQVQSLGDTTYLWSPPLSALQDKEAKAKLWSALKQLFRLS
jgi:hypothetical protein